VGDLVSLRQASVQHRHAQRACGVIRADARRRRPKRRLAWLGRSVGADCPSRWESPWP
jgi:hypothetical protein